MDKLVSTITSFVSDNEDSEKNDVIRYGIEIFILKSVFWIFSLLIGIFMGSFLECLFYMIAFTILRSFAGGYHANSRKQCFFQSVITIFIALVLQKLVVKMDFLLIICFFAAVCMSIVVWKYAPIDTQNKQLEYEEKIIFKKKTRIVLLAELFIAVLLFILHINTISFIIFEAIITSGILLLAGLRKY
jgi:accessory gene regulator B